MGCWRPACAPNPRRVSICLVGPRDADSVLPHLSMGPAGLSLDGATFGVGLGGVLRGIRGQQSSGGEDKGCALALAG